MCFVCCLFVFGVESYPCSSGVGPTAEPGTSDVIPRINWHRPEDAQWFVEQYLLPGVPVIIQQTTMREDLMMPARLKWKNLDYLSSGDEQVTVQHALDNKTLFFDAVTRRPRSRMSMKQFMQLVRSNSSSLHLLFSDIPKRLEHDLHHPLRDPDFWKWLPCLEEKKRRFPLRRKLVVGNGGPQNLEAVASPWDEFIFVANGQRRYQLFPPHVPSATGITRHTPSSSPSSWVHSSVSPGSFRSSSLFSPSAGSLSLVATLEEGQMLFVPSMWWKRVQMHCLHVSVETHMDLRLMTRDPLRRRYLHNASVSVHEAFDAARSARPQDTQVCPQHIKAHRWWQQRVRKEKWIMAVAIGVVTVLFIVYGISTIRSWMREEQDNKEKKNK